MIRRILGKITFSCLRITEMVESEVGTQLSFWDRIRYRTHLAACSACRSYEKQSALIGKALSRLMYSSTDDAETMDDSTKQKILEKLKEIDQ